jgi:carboxypeptidase C (cathepsin A)
MLGVVLMMLQIFGLVVELGPLWLNDLSFDHDYNITGIPQFVRNPYAWTKFASVLIVDSPPPVGFSYCTQYGPAANGTSCGAWNDTLTAEANANFIINWFKMFPEYAKTKKKDNIHGFLNLLAQVQEQQVFHYW